MIEYKHVKKGYNGTPIIKDLSFTIPDGEFVVLIGPSGCGKTTTLKMMNRLIGMDSGSISIDGNDINTMNPEKLRTGIGYVIQQIGLFPNMTVEENICVVPNLLKWDKERCVKRVEELMELVDMSYDEYAKKYPSELSGGQQQRIGVLRALAAEPPLILMDEPFSALDPITRESLQDEVKTLQQKLHKTVIFVTHDMDEAIKLADTIVFMYQGEIMQMASPEEMLHAPANDIVRDFMGKRALYADAENMSCSDLMKKRVYTVPRNKKTLECVQLMSQKEINSLVVVDDEKRFEGVVTIEAIRQGGHAGRTIEDLIEQPPTVTEDTIAKTAFDLLTSTKADYLLVLKENGRVAGIITKTSMSKALASVVWGD